jgi:hypothetical protein
MPADANADASRERQAPYRPPAATQRLIDELYREELLEARAMSPSEKVLAGRQLFESACRITLAGIRNQNPGVSDEQCWEILRQRLEWQKNPHDQERFRRRRPADVKGHVVFFPTAEDVIIWKPRWARSRANSTGLISRAGATGTAGERFWRKFARRCRNFDLFIG